MNNYLSMHVQQTILLTDMNINLLYLKNELVFF